MESALVSPLRVAALIVAGGRGTRAAGPIPKQYRQIAGRPLLGWTLDSFARHPAVGRVMTVIHPDDMAHYTQASQGFSLSPPALGGASRQQSVLNGLERLAADPPDVVLIHDGARPLVSAALIDRVLAGLAEADGAIAALPVTDTLKGHRDGLAATGPDRTGLWRAQTPQAFRFEAILAAHRSASGADLTDDAAVAERAGLRVKLVAGTEDNFKVTQPEDFERLETALLARLGDVRTGMGFDVHAFADTPRDLMLGGIKVPHDRGMAGHSDADVALHAIVDALLGAIADGDIGRHFPPSDPRWKGEDSATFARFAASRVAAKGGVIAHVDLTIICEAPKVSPHAAAMQARIADLLGVSTNRVSVKATTTEKLGFTGRREGIAAQAIATVRL